MSKRETVEWTGTEWPPSLGRVTEAQAKEMTTLLNYYGERVRFNRIKTRPFMVEAQVAHVTGGWDVPPRIRLIGPTGVIRTVHEFHNRSSRYADTALPGWPGEVPIRHHRLDDEYPPGLRPVLQYPTPEQSMKDTEDPADWVPDVLLARDLLTKLGQRERAVVTMRFGIGLPQSMTLDAIGEHFGITRERVRQIEAMALEKMRMLVAGLAPVRENKSEARVRRAGLVAMLRDWSVARSECEVNDIAFLRDNGWTIGFHGGEYHLIEEGPSLRDIYESRDKARSLAQRRAAKGRTRAKNAGHFVKAGTEDVTADVLEESARVKRESAKEAAERRKAHRGDVAKLTDLAGELAELDSA